MPPAAGGSFYKNRPRTPQKFLLIRSFLGVQGAIFQKSPLVAEGKKII